METFALLVNTMLLSMLLHYDADTVSFRQAVLSLMILLAGNILL